MSTLLEMCQMLIRRQYVFLIQGENSTKFTLELLNRTRHKKEYLEILKHKLLLMIGDSEKVIYKNMRVKLLDINKWLTLATQSANTQHW